MARQLPLAGSSGRSPPVVVSVPPALRLPTSFLVVSTMLASTLGFVPVPPRIVSSAAAAPGLVPVSSPPTAGLPLSAASPGVMPSLPSDSGPLGVLMAAIKEAVRGEVAATLGSSGVHPFMGIVVVALCLLGVEPPLLVRAWLQLESLQGSDCLGGGSGRLCLMSCMYGSLFPWGAWLFPLGCAPTGGDLQFLLCLPSPFAPHSYALTLFLPF